MAKRYAILQVVESLAGDEPSIRQGNSLKRKLDGVINQLDRKDNKINALITQTNDLVANGVLTEIEGDSLIELANRLIAAINSSP